MRLYVTCLLIALVGALLIPISAEAQLTDAACVAVYDANGDRVAHAPWGFIQGSPSVFFIHQGRIAPLEIYRDEIRGRSSLYFTGSNCTGATYMSPFGDLPVPAHAVGNDVWYADTQATAASVQYGSARSEGAGVCTNQLGTLNDALPAYNFTLPNYTPPFHLEPEPCFTPNPAVAALTPYGLAAMALVLAFGAYLMVRQDPAVTSSHAR